MIPEYIQFIKYLDEHLPDFKPHIIFDIGSRDCMESIEFSKRYPSSQIYAFEPNPFQEMECRNNIKPYLSISLDTTALSNYEGTNQFYITDGNIGASSLLEPMMVPWTSNQHVSMATVNVTTLDQWTEKNRIKSIDILWMDVQGNELNVLQGSTSILKKTKIISTEGGLKPYYKEHTLRNDIVDFLTKHGFLLVYENKEWEYESNFIFVNKSELV